MHAYMVIMLAYVCFPTAAIPDDEFHIGTFQKFVSLKLCLSVWLLTHPLKKRWFTLRCSQHFSVVKNLTDQAMPPAAWATKLGVWSVGPRAATWCWRGTGGIRKNPMAHMVAIKFRPKIEGFNHSSHIQM